MIDNWEVLERRPAQDFGLFKIWKKRARSPRTGRLHQVWSLQFPDWVLVVPVTPDRRVVMVRQYRHGNERIGLELPGGLVDPADGAPAEAAERELLEETGFRAAQLVKIGECFPQPAILTNRCHFYLARNAEKVQAPALETGEDIETELLSGQTVAGMLARGEIVNGMVQLALTLLARHPAPEGLDLAASVR